MPLKQRVSPNPPLSARLVSCRALWRCCSFLLGEGAAPRGAQRGAGSTGVAAGTRGEPAARRGDNCPRAGTSEPRHLPKTCAAPLQPAPLLCHRVQSLQPPRLSSLCRRGTCPGTARHGSPRLEHPERSGVLGGSSAAGLQKVGVRSNRARRKPQTITCLLLEGTNDTGLSLPSSFLPSGAPSPSAPVGSGVCGGRWGRRGLKLPFSG